MPHLRDAAIRESTPERWVGDALRVRVDDEALWHNKLGEASQWVLCPVGLGELRDICMASRTRRKVTSGFSFLHRDLLRGVWGRGLSSRKIDVRPGTWSLA